MAAMIFLIASTCMLAPTDPVLFHRLAEKGIQLTFHPTPRTKCHSRGSGLLLISDFREKAPIFRKWFPMARFYPSNKITYQKIETRKAGR